MGDAGDQLTRAREPATDVVEDRDDTVATHARVERNPTEARQAPGPRSRVADAAFAACAVATFVCYFIKSSGVVIKSDDWLMAFRGNSFVDYFRPYESNVSVVPIAVYHFVYTTFGFGTYWPLRFIGVGSHVAIATAAFLVLRSRWGSAVALVVGVAILWYPDALLVPALFNHWLALAASIVAAWALTQPPGRSDWVLAAALTFALCSSGVGVAAMAGCLVYVALSGAPLRRWIAVGIPSVLFVVWWFTLARDDHGNGLQTSAIDTVRYARDGIFSSFQVLSPGNRWLGITLTMLFVAWLAWRLRKGPRAAAHEIAWTCAIATWWIGLAFTRGPIGAGMPDSFRYRLVTFCFAAVALLPSARSPRTRRLLTSPKAVPVALCAALALIVLNGPAIFHHADSAEVRYRQQVQTMIVLNQGRDVIPDNTMVRFDIYTAMTARQYRGLVAKYGMPADTQPAHPDAALISLGDIKPISVTDPATTACTSLDDPTVIPPRVDTRSGSSAMTSVYVRAGQTDVVVQLRRFEPSWVTIGEIASGTTARIDLPVLMGKEPWILRAVGACQMTG